MTKAAVAKTWTLHTWPNGSRRSRTPQEFPLGEWVDITPSGLDLSDPETGYGLGHATDHNLPGTLYFCLQSYDNILSGLYKTIDYGFSWARIGAVTPQSEGASDYIDQPIRIRIDPEDSDHLYCASSVRGSAQGFFISTDGGLTFSRPAGLASAASAASVGNYTDVYDIAVDPTDFDRILISFHYEWGGSYGTNCGVMESTNGGTSWTVHTPESTWGTGHSLKFLYDPDNAQGNASTWLLGTQSNGLWRTSNAGASWAQVSSVNIAHGGMQGHYTEEGVLYVGGETCQKSTDNGTSFSTMRSGAVAWSVFGDGTDLLYSHNNFAQPVQTSPETDGATWDDLDATDFRGAFEQSYDRGLLIGSFWNDGIWIKRLRSA